MLIYTIVFLFIIFNIFISKHSKGDKKLRETWFMCSCLLVLWLMSACRFQVGNTSDMYRNYIHCYAAAYTPWRVILQPSFEYLHGILRKTIITVFRDPQAYFFVTALFISGTIFFTHYRYSPEIYLAVLMYYVNGGYFGANNTTRQYIAVCISLFGIKYIIEENPVKFGACVLIALGFHTSAFVVVPLYFLRKVQFNRSVLVGYMVAAVFLVVFNKQITRIIQLVAYSNYDDGYGTEASNPLRLVWAAFSVCCLMIIKLEGYKCVPRNYEYDSKEIEIFNNLLSHGTFLAIMCSLLSATSMLLFSRVGMYFSQFSLMNMLYGIRASKNRVTRFAMRSALVILIVAWFTAMNYAGKYIPTPYTPFWEYPQRYIPYFWR